MKYQVFVYGNGSNKVATQVREYETWRAAKRYQDAQVAKGICAVAQRKGAKPVATNQHGSW